MAANIATLTVTANANHDKTWSQSIDDFLKEGSGIFRTLQAIERIAKGASLGLEQIGVEGYTKASEFSEKMGAAASALVLPRLKSTSEKACSAVLALLDPQKQNSYQISKNISDIAEGVSSCSWAATLISENGIYEKVGKIFDSLGSLASLSVAAADFRAADQLLSIGQTGRAIRIAATESKKEALFRIAKATLTLVAPVLALLAIVLAPWASLALKLTSSAVAIGLHFYEKKIMTYQKIGFEETSSYIASRRQV